MIIAGKSKPLCDCEMDRITRPLRCNEEEDDE
jgi:hypothetical protein